MKKKIVALLLMGTLVFSFTACGEKEAPKEETKTEATTETKAEAKGEKSDVTAKEKDFDGSSYSDTGDGTFFISTAGGTSENGNTPVIYAEPDTSILQIGCDAEGMNGNALSYIYVDGILLDKMQLADTQSSLDLTPDQLSVGSHSVEVVQYENDDTSSNVITYKSASYEVKSAE